MESSVSEVRLKSYLKTTNDMDDHHQVSWRDEPRGSPQRDEHVVVDVLPENPVSYESHWEVANGVHEVGPDHAFPHRHFGWRLGGRRDGGLNLQDHRVPRKGRWDLAERIEHPEHVVRRAGALIGVAHVGDSTVR